MAVKDLEARQGNVNLTLSITEKGDIREFEKFGKKGRVCNAKGKDETGIVTLTLWNDDCDAVNEGDTVKIENGWVSEWQGELQLSTGKFGKLEITGKATADEKMESEVLSNSGSDQGEQVLSDDEKTEEESLEGMHSDSGEHVLTKDEKIEEEVLDSLDEEPINEEKISDSDNSDEKAD